MSKRSLTKSELSKFFAQGKKKAGDAASERLSQMSKGSAFKNQLVSKLRERQEADAHQPPPVDNVMEMAYVDKPDEDELMMRDEGSVATEVVDGLSVAPTELLANEYKKLVEQYEEEQMKR